MKEHNNACFIVEDATGQALGYFYGRRLTGPTRVKLVVQARGNREVLSWALPGSPIKRGDLFVDLSEGTVRGLSRRFSCEVRS